MFICANKLNCLILQFTLHLYYLCHTLKVLLGKHCTHPCLRSFRGRNQISTGTWFLHVRFWWECRWAVLSLSRSLTACWCMGISTRRLSSIWLFSAMLGIFLSRSAYVFVLCTLCMTWYCNDNKGCIVWMWYQLVIMYTYY